MDQDHSNLDFGKMSNMLELVKQFSGSNNNNSTPQTDQPEIDSIVNSREMNVIKAALPYMNLDNQKKLAVFVKFLEFIKTMKLYNSYSVNEISELNKTNMSKRDMIYAMRAWCSDKNKQLLDIVLNMYTLKSMITTMNNPSLQQQEYNPANNPTNPMEPPPNENLNQEELIERLKNLMQG